MSILAHVFEAAGQLDRLEDYTSRFGAEFYNLPLNEGTITLVKEDGPVTYPDKIETGAGPVTVFNPGFPLHWRVAA
jgi:dihydroorotase